jgi:solute carrier family 6 amino acid transporter-like protein 5/7/9/14
MIVTTLDTFTSLLAGFTIFGILGNLAHNLGETDLSKVISSGGSGLAFISYPDAIAKFQFVPQVSLVFSQNCANYNFEFFSYSPQYSFSCYLFLE